MKHNLILHIEWHPYGFQGRYRNPVYMKCRAKKCSVDKINNFKVGDFRIGVDEVTGRLGGNQFNDNDPYFSACFFHLQCFEELTYTPDLAIRNIIIADTPGAHQKEPDCARLNKMGVVPATLVAFKKWREMAIERLSENLHWEPQEEETLAVVVWLSGIRKGHKHARAPLCITSEDIEHKCATHPGWGGKCVSGLSVADMNEMELQGRSSQLIASRNGKTGKRGMKEPDRIKRKQLLTKTKEEYNEHNFALAGSITVPDNIIVAGSTLSASIAVAESPLPESIEAAGVTLHDGTAAPRSSPEPHFPGNTQQKQGSTGGDVGYHPPVKRCKAALPTPENSHMMTCSKDVTSTPLQSNPDTYIGDGGYSRNLPLYDRNYIPSYILSPNSLHHDYSPLNYHYPPATYHPPQAQYYRPLATHHAVQNTNQGQLANYFSPPGRFLQNDNSQDSNYNAPATSPSVLAVTTSPTGTRGRWVGEVESGDGVNFASSGRGLPGAGENPSPLDN